MTTEPAATKASEPASAPDGGWGWVVLIGSFVSFFIADGWSYSFGVLFPSVVEYFDESRGKTALIGTLLYATPMILSPLACALVDTYGCRPVAVCGGALTGVSLAVASMASSVVVLCIIVGVLSAVGLALVYISSLFVVTNYFERRRGFALGLAVTGSAIGAFAFPPLIEWLDELYAWRGSMLIAGAICLHIIATGMLYRPLSVSVSGDGTSGTTNSISHLKRLASEFRKISVSMCSRSVLTSCPFLVFCVTNFVVFLWVSVPIIFVVDLALLNDGVTKTGAAMLLSLVGGGRLVGQIVFGVIGDIRQLSTIGLYGFGITVAGVATALVPVIATVYPALAISMVIFGVAVSTTYVLPVICLVKMVGLENSLNAFGILQLTQGIAILLGTPVAG